MPSAAATKSRATSAPSRAAPSKPASSRRPARTQAKQTLAEIARPRGAAASPSTHDAARDARNAENLARAKAAAAAGDEAFVFSPDIDPAELSAVERRFIEGKERSPRDAQEGLRRLAERSLDTQKYPQGIAWIGVPDEDDA